MQQSNVQKQAEKQDSKNVGQKERWASTGIGGLLLAYGLKKKRAPTGIISMLGGSLLALRGSFGRCPLYKAMGVDQTAEGRTRSQGLLDSRRLNWRRSLTVHSSVEDVFQKLRNPDNIKHYSKRINVRLHKGSRRAHFEWTQPRRLALGGDIEVYEIRDNERICWRSVSDGAFQQHEGCIHLRPAVGNRGAVLQLEISYEPPGGVVGASAMKVFSVFVETAMSEALHRIQQFVETGEVATIEGQTSARGESRINRYKQKWQQQRSAGSGFLKKDKTSGGAA